MSPKLMGYDFWNCVLKSPQYVAAPMVDMSELPFRMLCRHFKAQLCFSPMLHSQQYLQDSLYRSDTFSTCPGDRPLVVQFCSNDPNDFVSVAMMIASQCDAVDLNLGCPQAIARKGHYGAFLDDDWDLVHSIVKKASSELPVPVTCKMRVLPGDFRNSVQFAKMLEDAGCSVITVHGRTKDQKGHATGLASWDAIKHIKNNIKIPVIANGNILSFTDIKECLDYTGADAVMSAEALLQNPALFTGKNPPVWTIVQKYLEYAEKYKTPIRSVRCHLFKILYLCIHQDSSIQQILAEGKTFADFYAVCDILKDMPKKYNSTFTKEECEVSDNYLIDFDFNSIETPCVFNETETDSDILLLKKLNFDSVPELNCVSEVSVNNDTKTSDYNCFGTQNRDELFEDKTKSPVKHLPIWLCHSRPRVVEEDNTTRGCYSKYFKSLPSSSAKDTEEQFISKKKLRRARHHERVLAAMKEKRKSKKMRHKQKLAEERQLETNEKVKIEDEGRVKITKKEKKRLIRERLLEARGSSPKVCINLGFASEMNEKELTRLSSQLRRLYGSNRQSTSPFHLYFCNFSEDDHLYKVCLAKNDGFSSYVVEMTAKSPEDLFQTEDLIYLSPDSENLLTSLDCNKIYVIGGIIDGTVKKDLSLSHAKQFSIQTAKLPIAEYLVRCSQNPGTTVLTVNQVFDILLKYYETEDWIQALSCNVPPRKGYCAPAHMNNVSTAVKAPES